jgi:hypothetical protein
VESASPHEVKLVEATIDSSFTWYSPDNLVGDKAYDSDSLDRQLFKERDFKLIAPHRRGRKKSSTQDGRKLRRYRRRWKVECLFAWLAQFQDVGCSLRIPCTKFPRYGVTGLRNNTTSVFSR